MWRGGERPARSLDERAGRLICTERWDARGAVNAPPLARQVRFLSGARTQTSPPAPDWTGTGLLNRSAWVRSPPAARHTSSKLCWRSTRLLPGRTGFDSLGTHFSARWLDGKPPVSGTGDCGFDSRGADHRSFVQWQGRGPTNRRRGFDSLSSDSCVAIHSPIDGREPAFEAGDVGSTPARGAHGGRCVLACMPRCERGGAGSIPGRSTVRCLLLIPSECDGSTGAS